MFNFSWTKKKDGDDIYAEHVNSLADGIKESQKSLRSFGDIPAFVTEANETSMIARRVATDVSALADEVEHISSELNNKPEKSDIPTKVSELENDAEYVTKETLAETTLIADEAKQKAEDAQETANIAQANVQTVTVRLGDVETAIVNKADKPTITTSTDTALSFEFSANTNTETRTNEVTSLSFTFGNGEYQPDYTSGLSFDSGETPTAIDYTDSGILNWVGTDCVTSDGLSIFQPSANTHYDIVFYFNGKQFIGLVNGYVPAGGNEAI